MHDQSSLSIYKRGVVDRYVRRREGNLCFIFSNSSGDCLFGILCNVELTRGISWVLPISPQSHKLYTSTSHLGNLDQRQLGLYGAVGAKINYALCQTFHDTYKVNKRTFVSNFDTKRRVKCSDHEPTNDDHTSSSQEAHSPPILAS